MTFMIIPYGGLSKKQCEENAFEMMCRAHPHETYAAFPDRFLAFVKGQNANLTKEDVEQILAETAAAHPEDAP